MPHTATPSLPHIRPTRASDDRIRRCAANCGAVYADGAAGISIGADAAVCTIGRGSDVAGRANVAQSAGSLEARSACSFIWRGGRRGASITEGSAGWVASDICTHARGAFTMRGTRGQSSIEVVALVPLVLVLAMGIVDASIVVRDRIAVADAAGRAGRAHIRGENLRAAARGGVPQSLRSSVTVSSTDDEITASVESSSRLLHLVGHGRLTASVVTDAGGAS